MEVVDGRRSADPTLVPPASPHPPTWRSTNLPPHTSGNNLEKGFLPDYFLLHYTHRKRPPLSPGPRSQNLIPSFVPLPVSHVRRHRTSTHSPSTLQLSTFNLLRCIARSPPSCSEQNANAHQHNSPRRLRGHTSPQRCATAPRTTYLTSPTQRSSNHGWSAVTNVRLSTSSVRNARPNSGSTT